MRYLLLLVVMAIGLAAGQSAALAAKCPTPRKASFEMWPAGTLTNGKTATATHACGRTLSCAGGRKGQKGSRVCHWL